MLALTFSCPNCRSTLKSDRPLRAGQTLQCLHCGTSFAVPDAAAMRPTPIPQPPRNSPASPLLPGPPAGKSSAVPVAVGVAPPPTQARPGGVAIPGRRHGVLLLSLVLGGLVLFLGAGLAVAVHCFSGATPPATTASIPQKKTDNRNDSTGPTRPAKADPVPEVPKEEESPPPRTDASIGTKKKPKTDVQRNPIDKQAEEKTPDFTPISTKKPVPPPNALTTLSAAQQQEVNKAIDKGARFLKHSQLPSGTWWAGPDAIGYAALPGLTLLECGIPATDPAVQKAAAFIRKNIGILKAVHHQTYQLSLVILFLDRLGEVKDRELIRALALRLVAGQTNLGGWGYHCPTLSSPEQQQLLAFLKQHQTPSLQELVAKNSPTDLKSPVSGREDPLLNPVTKPQDPKQLQPGDVPHPKSDANQKPKVVKKVRPEQLSASVRSLAVVQRILNPRGQMLGSAPDDNSNSQFAIMALWVGRRYDVPVELTMALVLERYHATQQGNGGWGYHWGNGVTNTMTCVGLIGLAVGHGTAQEAKANLARASKNMVSAALPQDPAIKKGLKKLGGYLDNPGKGRKGTTMTNLYFLWSVERVGVLYQLKTIGNRDWYGWGVEMLLHHQKSNGSWFTGSFPGSSTAIDTSMALLFLKRVNFVQDLTENLRLYMPVTDPEGTPAKK